MPSLPCPELYPSTERHFDVEPAIIRQPLTIAPEASVVDALRLMSRTQTTCMLASDSRFRAPRLLSDARASCVLVMDRDRVAGIVTEGDIVRLSVQGACLATLCVADVMTQSVLTLPQSKLADLFIPLNLFQQYQIRHLPILDDQDRLVGLLTQESLRYQLRSVDLLRRRLVRDVMTTQVIHAKPQTTLLTLAQMMVQSRVSSVVIADHAPLAVQGNGSRAVRSDCDDCDLCDEATPERCPLEWVRDRELPRSELPPPAWPTVPLYSLGIVTDRDLVQLQALGVDLAQVEAQAVMSRPVLAVCPGDSLWTVQERMRTHWVSRVVVEGASGELLGIVTQSHLLQALHPREIYRIVETLEARIAQLEAEKQALMAHRNGTLEQQMRDRTVELTHRIQRERLVRELTDRIHQSMDLEEMWQIAVQGVRRFLQADRVIVYQFAPDMTGTVVAESVGEPWSTALHAQIQDTCFQQGGGRRYLEGHRWVVANIDEAYLTPCHWEMLRQFQVKSNLVVPIVVRPDQLQATSPADPHPLDEPRLWGLLIVHQCDRPRHWQTTDLDLLDQLAVQLAIAIHQATVYQQAQTELIERRRTEAMLKERERYLSTLIGNLPGCVYRVNNDPAYTAEFISEGISKITGYEQREYIVDRSISYGQIIHPDDRDQLWDWIQAAVAERKTFECEYRIFTRSGQMRWVWERGQGVYAEDGTLLYLEGFVTDITARKQAEAALRTSEQHYRLLFDSHPHPLWVYDIETLQFLAVNEAAIQQYGYAREEFLAMTILALHPPAEVPALLQKLQEINHASPEEANVREWRHLRKNGTLMQVEITSNRLQFQGRSARLVLATDITARRQAEAQIAFQASILDQVRNAVVVADLAGRITSWNPAAAALYQFTPEALGRSLLEIASPAADPQTTLEIVQQVRTNGTWEGEVMIQPPEGKALPTHTIYSLLHDRAGAPCGLVGISMDISDRKAAEQALRASQAELMALFNAMQEVILVLDRRGRYLKIAPSAAPRLYKPPEELLGKTLYEVFPPEQADFFLAQIHQALERHVTQKVEYRLPIGDREIWFDATVAPLDAETVVWVARDIGDRKRLEADLREANERYEMALTGIGEGVWDWNIVDRTVMLSPRYWAILGEPESARMLEVEQCLRQVHPDDREGMMQAMQRHFEQRIPYEAEFRMRHHSGDDLWVRSRGQAIWDEQGRPIRMVGAISDITDRKRTEQALQKLVEGTAAFTGKDFFAALVQCTAEALEVPFVYVTELVSDRHLETLAFWANNALQSPLCHEIHQTPCEQVLIEQVYCCPSGVSKAFPDDEYLRLIQAEGYLGVALLNADGIAIGELCIIDTRPLKDPERMQSVLQIFAARAAAEIDRQSAITALQQLNHQLEARVEQRTIALREKEAKLRAIFNSSFQHTALFTPDGRIVDMNQTVLDVHQTSLDELVGQYIWNIAWYRGLPETQARLRQAVAQSAQGYFCRTEMSAIRQDGSLITVDVSFKPLFDDAGQVYQLLAEGWNITDRKQAEEALRESQAQLQRQLAEIETIYQSAPIGLNVLDKNLRFVRINQQLAEINGLPISAHLGRTVREVLPDLADQAEQFLRHILDTGEPLLNVEIRGETPAQPGVERTWLEQFWPLKSGDQIIGISTVCEEITDRKKAEEALRQQLEKEKLFSGMIQRIRNSLELGVVLDTAVAESRQILQADRVLVFQLLEDGTGKVIAESLHGSWQPIIEGTFSVEVFPPEIYDRYLNGYVCNIPDRREFEGCLLKFMEEWQIYSKLVVPVIQKDNDRLWGLLIVHECDRPRDWQPWEIELMQQLADQLEIAIRQSELYQQLQETNAHLARATRLKDEFLANMSHELRTPLNAILGMAEGLRESIFGEVSDRQRHAITTIEQSGRHLLELINDILDLAKIEAGKLELSLQSISVNYLCQSSLAFVKQPALKKRIQIKLNVANSIQEVLVDERRMRQVLINLLNNAVKFTPEGGSIVLAVDREVVSDVAPLDPSDVPPIASWVSFSVIDTGIGIAPEHMGKLFQSFVQIDSQLNRQYTGTGLGLALVRRIVEMHGGTVTVRSEVGRGSCFTVRIPDTSEVSLESARGLAESGTNRELYSLEDPGVDLGEGAEVPLILLAEDNQANVDTMSSYLESRGFSLILASHGQEAVTLAQTHHPNLILMDIQMPGLDGLAAIQRIRQDPALVNVPIVALTALAMPGDQEKCLAAGANEYMSKPIRLKQLAIVVQRLLKPSYVS